jgi:CheY-like chemotaxis protein
MPLYKSKAGRLACAEHAPLADVTRWTVEGWQRVPQDVVAAEALRCERCRQESPGAEPGGVRRPKPLILNVDDRPASLYARERMLRLKGFVVVNAQTARAAIEAAERYQPSAVLLDVHLPDGDGREICRRMKSHATLARIPVILISATLRSHSEHIDSLHWGQADGYLIEPCDPETIASTLRKVVTAA